MLSVSMQSSTALQTSNSVANGSAPASAEKTNAVAPTDVNCAQETMLVSEVEGEFFAGQLNEVLDTADQLLPEVTAEQQGQQQSPEQQNLYPQPDAETWLQAMFDQQQLQLQARDTVVPEVPLAGAISAMAPLSVNAGAAAQASQKKSTTAVDDIINSHAASVLLPDSVLAQQRIHSDSNTKLSAVGKTDDLGAKTTSNPTVGVAFAAIETPAADTASNAAVTGSSAALTNTSVAMSSSTANLVQFATASMGEANASGAGVNETLVPTALTTSGVDNAQRTVQTQLNLHAPEAKWGEQLLHALRDNVQVQIQQKIQNATIRLDPPELGSLEIYISHESGRLHVQITASQADVARLIQHTSDRLRQELSGPQFTQVNIQTSAEGQSGQQQSRERQRFMGDELILANEKAFVGNDQQTKRPADVLVTV